MDVEFLLERLERYILEESPKVLGVRAVNEDEVRQHLAQIRASVPEEVSQARSILRERDVLLEEARQEARRVVAKAQTQIEEAATEHRLVQEARQKAEGLVRRARREADVLRSDADEYVFDSLSQLQAELSRLLHVVENGLQKLEGDREKGLQAKTEEEESRSSQV